MDEINLMMFQQQENNKSDTVADENKYVYQENNIETTQSTDNNCIFSIFNQFNEFYEQRCNNIDEKTNGNCIELKYPIYVEWVSILREQTSDLINTLQGLEREAVQRLSLLETKLTNDKDKINRHRNDVNNLLEVIRRARVNHVWNVDGLEFNEVNYIDIFGDPTENKFNNISSENTTNNNDKTISVNIELNTDDTKKFIIEDELQKECKCLMAEVERLNSEIERKKEQLQNVSYSITSSKRKISATQQKQQQQQNRDQDEQQQFLYAKDNDSSIFDDNSNSSNRYSVEIDSSKYLLELKTIIKEKDNRLELLERDKIILTTKLNEFETLVKEKKHGKQTTNKKEDLDKLVLVTEVAEKYDMIVKLRKDLCLMDEKFQIKEKQLKFKDDIIKELRYQYKKSKNENKSSYSLTSSAAPTSSSSLATRKSQQIQSERSGSTDSSSTLTSPPCESIDSDSSSINNRAITDDSDRTLIPTSDHNSINYTEINKYERENHELMKQINLYTNAFENETQMVKELQEKLYKSENDTKNMEAMYKNSLIKLYLLKMKLVTVASALSYSKLVVLIDNLNGIHKNDNENKESANVFQSLIETLQVEIEQCTGSRYDDIKYIENDMKFELTTVECINTAISEMKNQINNLKYNNLDMKQINDKLNQTLKDRNDENENLKSYISTLQQLMNDAMKTKENNCDCEQESTNTLLLNTKYTKLIDNLRNSFKKILGKPLSDQTIQELTNGDKNLLDKLLVDLKNEIDTKDCLLTSTEEQMLALKDNLKIKDRNIYEIKKKFHQIEKDCNYKNETIEKLNQTLGIHLDTISRLKTVIEQIRMENTELQNSLTRQETSMTSILSDKIKLETEVFKNNFKELQNSTDDDDVLCEQLHNIYTENLKLDKQINFLRDENLYLREHIYHWTEDYTTLKIYKNQNLQIDPNITSDYEETIRNLDDQKDLLQSTIDIYERKITEKDSQILSIQQQTIELHKRIDELNVDINKYKTNACKYIKENEILTNQIHTFRNNCKCCKSIPDVCTDDKNTQIIDLEFRLVQKDKELTKTLDALKIAEYNLKNAKHMAFEGTSKLSNETREHLKIINDAKEKIIELENRLEKRDEEINKLNEKILATICRDGELNAELNAKNLELSHFHIEQSKLREEVNSLSDEIIDNQNQYNLRERKLINELNIKKKIIEDQLKDTEKERITNLTIIKDISDWKSKYDKILMENSLMKDELQENMQKSECQRNVLEKLLEKSQAELMEIKKEMENLLVVLNNSSKDLENKNQTLITQNKNCQIESDELNEKCKLSDEKFFELQNQCELLKRDYNKLLEIKKNATIALEVGRKVEKENKDRQQAIEQQAEHIQSLLSDRRDLITKIDSLHKDNVILNSELLKYKDAYYDESDREAQHYYLPSRRRWPSQTYARSSSGFRSDPELNEFDTIRKLKQTTGNIARTRKYWQHNVNSSQTTIEPESI